MNEVDGKVKTSETKSSIDSSDLNSLKKSRKNKTPVFRQQRKTPEVQCPTPQSTPSTQTTFQPIQLISEAKLKVSPPKMVQDLETSSSEKKSPLAAAPGPQQEDQLPPTPGGIKSYSDFMRSLAAKYNNNEYYTSNRIGIQNSADSIFQPFKTGTSSNISTSTPSPTNPAAIAAAAGNPFLGFSPPFPFPLGPGNIPNFAAAMGVSAAALKDDGRTARLQLPGLPAGLPLSAMMDLTSTQAILNLARSVPGGFFPPPNTSHSGESPNLTPSVTLTSLGTKAQRRTAESSPLDLSGNLGSSSPSPLKRPRLELFSSPGQSDDSRVTISPSRSVPRTSLSPSVVPSQIQPDPTILTWTVQQVSNFVASIDICKEYAEVFVEHNIDGSLLPLLTEDHLTVRLGLKLGPALKLRSIVAKKVGSAHLQICDHCLHCHQNSLDNKTETTVIPSVEIKPVETPENTRAASRSSSQHSDN